MHAPFSVVSMHPPAEPHGAGGEPLPEFILSAYQQRTSSSHLCALRSTVVGPALVDACVRGFTPHWNSTVNKMSHEVLKLLREAHPASFAAATEVRRSRAGGRRW